MKRCEVSESESLPNPEMDYPYRFLELLGNVSGYFLNGVAFERFLGPFIQLILVGIWPIPNDALEEVASAEQREQCRDSYIVVGCFSGGLS